MRKKTKILGVALLTIFAGLIIGFYPAQPKRISFDLPLSSINDKSWDVILNSTHKIDSFKVLNTGAVKVPLEGMLNLNKISPSHDLDEYLWVDVFAFLFHHKEKGWFMIDTGLDSTYQNKGNIKGPLAGNYIKGTRQAEGQNIAAQLQRENKTINGIFITHLHGDHTSGLPEIDSSISKYVGKGEQYLNIPFLYHTNHFNQSDELRELDWEQGAKKAPFKSVMDIFGDGSFLALHTPGHSNSHLSYLLVTSEGSILLTGDASHTRYGFENVIEPGWIEEQKLAESSLDQLVKFHQRFPEVRIIYGHEL